MKRKRQRSETHKIHAWALRRANGSFACIRQGATIPLGKEDISFYFSDNDRALSFNWLLLRSRSQAEWYRQWFDIPKDKRDEFAGYVLHPVKVEVTIKITPKSDSCVKWK